MPQTIQWQSKMSKIMISLKVDIDKHKHDFYFILF